MSKTLRSPEGKERYKEHMRSHPSSDECFLCVAKSLKDFQFWKVTENNFPYDQIASVHHMLTPFRHVAEEKLNDEEIKELQTIKKSFIDPEYDWIIEATLKNKTIPDHFHIHLIVGK